MDDLIDLIAADESPSQVSDKIKELLFAKSSEKIDQIRPSVSNQMFADPEEIEDEIEEEDYDYDDEEEGE